MIDAAIDARPDAIPAGCYGVGLLIVCPNNPVTGNTSVSITTTTSLNTANAPQCEPYHLLNKPTSTEFCVIAAKTVTVGPLGRWNITGTKPLVVIATNSMSIEGVIDAASHRGGLSGPGADPTACIAGTTPTMLQGGPGGSFGTVGGDGGGIDVGLLVPAGPKAGALATLRGGCTGRDGDGANGGAAGHGGGAVYLIANNLLVSGTINASGASGTGAGLNAGGGGGGSGGMIGLDAPSLTVSGKIFANGGGGGEGGGGANGGNSGVDAISPTLASDGGAGNASAGGDAGNGAFMTTAAQDGMNGSASGGGGGGGAGVIKVFPMKMLGGAVSPPPS